MQVKEAAKEAVEGVGYDVLVICGFAFDPDVAEEAKQYGRLTVLPARMNPDLAMGDELLKKTGAGNLFMVFGDPDLDVRKTKDGELEVEIRGLDIYDRCARRSTRPRGPRCIARPAGRSSGRRAGKSRSR